MDSIFHSVFVTHDEILEEIEGRRLAPLLAGVLRRLHDALPAAAASYPPEVAADLEVYLAVPRALLSGAYTGQRGRPRSATWSTGP